MTLQEAIDYLRESISDDTKDWCDECKNEHIQLLEWLEELKGLREVTE